MPKKAKKYSSAEKKAYYMGLGAARTGGRVEFIKKFASGLPDRERRSFYNGVDAGLINKK